MINVKNLQKEEVRDLGNVMFFDSSICTGNIMLICSTEDIGLLTGKTNNKDSLFTDYEKRKYNV